MGTVGECSPDERLVAEVTAHIYYYLEHIWQNEIRVFSHVAA
jgi:hypothetical protein